MPFSMTLRAAALLFFTALIPTAEAAKPGTASTAVPNGAITDPTPTLVWDSVDDATQYQVEAYDKTNAKLFSKKFTVTDGHCTTEPFCSVLTPKPFEAGASKWRVRAGNGDGWGPWSGWAKLWVGGGPVISQTHVTNPASALVAGAQTVLSISIDVPGPGAVSVSSHGYLRCTRSNAAGTVDVSTVVTDDPADIATGAGRPGFLALTKTMAVGERVSFNQAATRVFEVAEGGTKTYYWRSNGFILNANDVCTIYSGTLTTEYIPYYMPQPAMLAGAKSRAGVGDGSSAAPR